MTWWVYSNLHQQYHWHNSTLASEGGSDLGRGKDSACATVNKPVPFLCLIHPPPCQYSPPCSTPAASCQLYAWPYLRWWVSIACFHLESATCGSLYWSCQTPVNSHLLVCCVVKACCASRTCVQCLLRNGGKTKPHSGWQNPQLPPKHSIVLRSSRPLLKVEGFQILFGNSKKHLYFRECTCQTMS